ncbi:hypothetical protein BS47DRAFT_1009349 [Hydnum rufescens UP504]|uniref:Uncharacterized protein n=1 Tax=Hydnum rufescens UP504 TaxID=1448309 RepID=A0A9P6E1R0_9AGAM|nr:hypothetical protein BS47DRAFT_1009349 [Hydnum rufescens UP504]
MRTGHKNVPGNSTRFPLAVRGILGGQGDSSLILCTRTMIVPKIFLSIPQNLYRRKTLPHPPAPLHLCGPCPPKTYPLCPLQSSQASSQSSPSKTPTQPHPMRRNRKLKSNTRPLRSESAPGAAGDAEQEEKSTEPSLRELMQDAYSRSSLHTFKSDPLHRRHKGEGTSNGRERGVGLNAAGRTGRGQPDMRKRMGALLAQIKSTTT